MHLLAICIYSLKKNVWFSSATILKVYLFLEFDSAERYLPMADTMIIYRWNRVYPADVIFSKDYLDCPWTLKETFEFSGHSHSKLTREVYVR